MVDTCFAQSQKNSNVIEITTHLGDKQSYFEGDTLEFLVTLSQSAYIMLIYEDASHNLIQILPNQYTPNAYLKAGIYRKIPDDDAQYSFTIAPPYGDEKLWAFAATEPFPELEGKLLDNGLKVLKYDLVNIKAIIAQHYKYLNLSVSSTSLSIQTYKTKTNLLP